MTSGRWRQIETLYYTRGEEQHRRRATERYAAGDFPNQSKGGDGLPKWTAVRAERHPDLHVLDIPQHHVAAID